VNKKGFTRGVNRKERWRGVYAQEGVENTKAGVNKV